MQYYLTFIFMIYYSVTYAQESIVPAGKDYQGNNGTVSFSIGQTAFHTLNGTGFMIEGVQQPYEISIVSTNELLKNEDHCRISIDNENKSLMVEADNFTSMQLTFSISDLAGKILNKSKITALNTVVDISTYSSQVYFLNIYSYANHLKTYKIIIH